MTKGKRYYYVNYSRTRLKEIRNKSEKKRREQTKIGQVRLMHNKSKMILKQKIAEDVQENKEGRTKEVSELHL